MSSPQPSNNYELKIYPIEDEFIASIELDNTHQVAVKLPSKVETVIILDRSGSMGNSVYKIVHSVLPKFFENLNYDDDADINLIAFECRTELHVKKVRDFKDFKMHSAGGTSMRPAVEKLQELFDEFQRNRVTALRILTISDGEVFDQHETKELGDKLAENALKMNITVNSQAVRFFTSRAQPDTTALCSLLQLNNVQKSQLTDVGAQKHHDKIAKDMADLFCTDGFDDSKILRSTETTFYKYPWDEAAVDEVIVLPNRRNIFWLDEPIKDGTKLTIDGHEVKVTVVPTLTIDMFQLLLNSKLDFIVDRMKILKVVNTDSAKLTIEKIVEYFTRIEGKMLSLLGSLDVDELDPKLIANRARLLKLNAIRSRKISTILATIANDEHVEKLNAAQKAEYLRSVQASSKAGRGLAKRASKGKKQVIGGHVFSFDEIIRAEVMKLKENFAEIDKIDDKKHAISFYSHATTLEGLRTLIEFVDDPQFNTFDANEILQFVNIVGVACNGPIGDFPDASSWRVNELFVGCYVSVSDIISACQQSGDSNYKLIAPGIEKEVTNVIPVFEDARIGLFLKKYAPSLLEYSSSVGIRRVIADVPMTFGYTIIAGIRRLLYDMNKQKSTAHMEAFKSFVTTAASFVGKYYDHIEELLTPAQPNDTNSFYLANNGIGSLIVPLIRTHGSKTKSYNMADVLRSVYSCEIWKGLSREFKGKVNFDQIVKEMLAKLLQIDIEKHKVHIQPPFTPEPERKSIKFHEDYHVDQEYLDKLSSPLYYHNYMSLLPKFIDAALDGPLETIKDVPEMTKINAMEAFDIKYSYNDFILFNVFQALRFPRTASRADTKEKRMKFTDVKHRDMIVADIKSYVRQQFESLYDYELKLKQHKEQSEIAAQLVTQLINETNVDNLIQMWRDGIKYKGLHYKLVNSTSIAFGMLARKVIDTKIVIPLRADIIRIMILGVDNDNKSVFNGGRIADIKNVGKFRKRFLLTRSIDEWKEIETNYLNRGVHMYRAKANRHGHDAKKPSYWGMGFAKLADYFTEMCNDDEMSAYYNLHEQCCDSSNVYSAVWNKRWDEKQKEYEAQRMNDEDDGDKTSSSSSDETFEDAKDDGQMIADGTKEVV